MIFTATFIAAEASLVLEQGASLALEQALAAGPR